MAGPLVMGVLNVTPDSFSDGGRFIDPDAAIAHGLELAARGADLVDVGGESTRPGAEPVTPEEERRRILPVIRELAAAGVRMSVDTVHATTAEAAVEAGAEIVNDVSGGHGDPGMFPLVASLGAPYVLMHSRGAAGAVAEYRDVVQEVRDELARQAERLVGLGADPARLILDPGLGFAKNGNHNWALLHGLAAIQSLGYPVLVGASRKRFVASLLPEGAPMTDRDLPTAVISALCARAGVWGVRVHDVVATRRALAVVDHWEAGGR